MGAACFSGVGAALPKWRSRLGWTHDMMARGIARRKRRRVDKVEHGCAVTRAGRTAALVRGGGNPC